MITHYLERMATFGAIQAIVEADQVTTYAGLLAKVKEWQGRLTEAGLRPGEVVALEATHSPDACAAMLALISAGAICVPMTGLPDAKRSEFEDVAQVERIARVDQAGGGVTFERTGRAADHQLYDSLREGGTAGLVLFSSGTTGRSKAALLDFDRVLARYPDRRRSQRTLSFLNLDHIGGINTLLHTLSQGGTIVTVPRRTPDLVFQAVEKNGIEVLPTTPTFLTMTLISGAHHRYNTGSLRLITYGTEPMPEQTLRQLGRELPNVRLKQTYGLSELGILSTKSKSDDSLWVRLGGPDFDYKVVDGVLWIKSKMAMLGYLNAPAPFDEAGYFNTQDAVEVEGEYLRILGRTSELINVAGEKVYPNEVESVLLEIDNIADATVVGRANPVTGMVVKAIIRPVRPENERALRRRVIEFCNARLEPYKVPAVVEISEAAQHSDRFKKLRRAS